MQIGEYYVYRRLVPAENVVRLKTEATDEVSRRTFEREIERPIAEAISRLSGHDRLLYIVLTKGIPLRIAGAEGREGTGASVDSELALLYRRMTGQAVTARGLVPNPYFLADQPLQSARPFTHEHADIFLVTRLDGFTVADVLALIDRAASPSDNGTFVLDGAAKPPEAIGNRWLQQAADALGQQGFRERVMVDTSPEVLAPGSQVLGYYSWGSNDPAITRRHLGLKFAPGALAATLVSTDARTFLEPEEQWNLGTWENRASYYAGSPQSLVGDLIRDGVTGVAGQVAEPFLDGTVRPNILFPAYAAGFNLAEAFYLAMPYLSWQAVVVGDPLCAPFRRTPLAGTVDPGPDPATELPAYFSARRLAAIARAGAKIDALKQMLRAEAKRARGDDAGARLALEQATALNERLGGAHLLLATLYEASGEDDRAAERYRRVLAFEPSNPIALNNLAWLLTEHKNNPQEAFALAQRAYDLAPEVPEIADTLAWVHHLLGQRDRAAALLRKAVSARPDSAQIRLHAAFVFARTGDRKSAADELSRALLLDPTLLTRDAVRALREELDAK